MPKLSPTEARALLAVCCALDDFHTLNMDAVEALTAAADRHGYRKPKTANGSRARSFHAFLTRTADSLQGQAREMVKGKNASVRLKRGKRIVWAHTRG